MPTITKTWHFTANSQSWAFTANGTSNTGIWQSTNGDVGAPGGDAGCINNIRTGKNHSGTGHWDLVGTWQALFGVPENALVTSVGGAAGDEHSWECQTFTTGAASTEGPFELRDSTGTTVLGTFTGTHAYSGTTAYARPAAASVSVPSAQQPSSATVALRLSGTVATGNSNNANNTLLQDEVTLTVTYELIIWDEDFWQNPVPPFNYPGFYPQQFSFEQNEIAPQPPVFSPDEDLWNNSVFPSVWPNLCQNQWAFDVDEPAGSLHGQPDEDFYGPPLPWPNIYIFPQQSIFDVQEPAGHLFGQPDEDFWSNPVSAVPATVYQRLPYLPDPEEIPAGNLIVPLPVDELYWQNQSAPVAGSQHLLLPYSPDPEELPAGSLFGQPDEDLYIPPLPWPNINIFPQQSIFDVQEPAGKLFGQPDEDFWDNPVFPTIWLNAYPNQWIFDVQEPAGNLFGQPDEDFWENAVPPVPAAVYQRLPYLPDPEEIPTGSLSVPLPVDEMYWQNSTAPVAGKQYLTLPYVPDPEEISSGSLHGRPIEEYWFNRVSPVTWTNTVPPLWQDRQDFAPSISIQFDEDYWQPFLKSPVSANQSLYQPDADEIIVSVVEFVEEEHWKPVVFPAPVFQNTLPYLPDSGDGIFPISSTAVLEEAVWANIPPVVWSVTAHPWQLPIGDEFVLFFVFPENGITLQPVVPGILVPASVNGIVLPAENVGIILPQAANGKVLFSEGEGVVLPPIPPKQ